MEIFYSDEFVSARNFLITSRTKRAIERKLKKAEKAGDAEKIKKYRFDLSQIKKGIQRLSQSTTPAF